MLGHKISNVSRLRQRAVLLLGLCTLISAIFLWPVFGHMAAYFALASALPAALLNSQQNDWVEILRAPWVWALCTGFVLVSISFILQPGQASIPYAGDFLFFALSPVLAAAVAPACRFWLTSTRLCIALLLVTALSAVVGLIGLVNGNARSSAIGFSPIHFADLAIIFGFMSLSLMFSGARTWRLIALIGPVLAIIAAVASGTRAAVPLAGLLSLIFGIFVIRRVTAKIWVKIVLPIIFLALIAAIFYLAKIFGFTRPWDAITAVSRVFSGDIWSDPSTAYRVEMYYGGWRAFLDAPLFGHGWHSQLQAAMPYLSERALEGYAAEKWGYIHNDALSLAVAAGVPGLTAYVLFITAPLLALWGSPVSEDRIYLAMTLSVGLLASGMTDVLLMVETPKLLLVLLSATLFYLGRPAHQ